MFHFTARN